MAQAAKVVLVHTPELFTIPTEVPPRRREYKSGVEF